MRALNTHTFTAEHYPPMLQERIWRAVRMLRDRLQPAGADDAARVATGILAPERYCAEYRVPKWSRVVTMAQVPEIMRAETRGQFMKAEHARAAIAWLDVARDARIGWQDAVYRALQQYGDHGPLISGIYRDHFPAEVKDELRTLARLQTFAEDASVAHWIGGAGRRIETWRRERDRVEGGSRG